MNRASRRMVLAGIGMAPAPRAGMPRLGVLLGERGGGPLVLPDSFNTVHRADIIALAARHRLPASADQVFE
jgi:hypothetical protein